MNPALLLPVGLAALAALIVPLLIHLARRSEQRPTDFAALRWLRQKPKPRHRIRFDEWPLLLLRLLLLALLALWLAKPVLSGADDTRPRVVVVPGVDASVVRTQAGDADARLRWLAAGFPSLDESAPAGPPAVASLLRQLDAELPAGAPLTVVVPATLQGADAERPVLSRAVTWTVVEGAMPAPAAPSRLPPSLTVRHAAGNDTGLRYLRAAALAWQPASSTSSTLQVGTADEALPPTTRPLVWLVPGPIPAAVAQWIDAGGTALLANDSTLDGFTADATPWRDTDGAPLVESATRGKGRVLRFTRPLRPDTMPALVDANVPQHQRALFDTPAAPPARVLASDYAPVTGGATYPIAPHDAQPWLALLIALLLLVERWMATRRARGVAP